MSASPVVGVTRVEHNGRILLLLQVLFSALRDLVLRLRHHLLVEVRFGFKLFSVAECIRANRHARQLTAYATEDSLWIMNINTRRPCTLRCIHALLFLLGQVLLLVFGSLEWQICL